MTLFFNLPQYTLSGDPMGVWTLESEGKAPTFDVTFDNAEPSFTHRALCTMEQTGIVKLVK